MDRSDAVTDCSRGDSDSAWTARRQRPLVVGADTDPTIQSLSSCRTRVNNIVSARDSHELSRGAPRHTSWVTRTAGASPLHSPIRPRPLIRERIHKAGRAHAALDTRHLQRTVSRLTARVAGIPIGGRRALRTQIVAPVTVTFRPTKAPNSSPFPKTSTVRPGRVHPAVEGRPTRGRQVSRARDPGRRGALPLPRRVRGLGAQCARALLRHLGRGRARAARAAWVSAAPQTACERARCA
jgi:hypothetical protein